MLFAAGVVLCSWGLFELTIRFVVKRYRKDFPWLITPQDSAPDIPETLVAKHAAGNYDPELGWVQKPNGKGVDETDDGTKTFTIDKLGRRHNPGFEDKAPRVSVFGDSFAFCRLVNDDETWAHMLSGSLSMPVQNYGVGNYGFDQALLRYERETSTHQSDVVVMAVVPETIARIQSYWKHYLEYGNVLAFKPRYQLAGDDLQIVPCAIESPNDYLTYQENIEAIQRNDRFYASKFQHDVLQFPYTLHLLKRWWRHIPILWNLIAGDIRGDRDAARRRAFAVVLNENARLTHKLYSDQDSCKLLQLLIERFAKSCQTRKAHPIVVILPQISDLKHAKAEPNQTASYTSYFERLKPNCQIIDMTSAFLAEKDWQNLYVKGALGPHLNKRGNALVAETLMPHLRKACETSLEATTYAANNRIGTS